MFFLTVEIIRPSLDIREPQAHCWIKPMIKVALGKPQFETACLRDPQIFFKGTEAPKGVPRSSRGGPLEGPGVPGGGPGGLRDEGGVH